MSRRKSKEDNKAERNQRKLDRKKNIRKDLDRVIIACEGSVTERNYFKSIFSELISNHNIAKTSLIIAKHSHTDPKGVLSDLLIELEKDDEFEHKWIVIDRDEHESFSKTLDQAKSENVNVAYSNPSFEFWFVLHFEDYTTPTHRHYLLNLLKKHINYKKNSNTTYHETLPFQEIAIKRSKKLIDKFTLDGRKLNPTTDNPSTTVYKLVEVLKGLQKVE
jgi:hypothetical protein